MPRPRDPNAKREKVEAKVTKEQKEKLRQHAEKHGKSMSKTIEEFIENLDSDNSES